MMMTETDRVMYLSVLNMQSE